MNTLGTVLTRCENPSAWRMNCFGNRDKLGNTGMEQRFFFCPMGRSNCPFLSQFWESSKNQVVVLYCTKRWDPNNHHHRGSRRNPIHLGWSQCCSSRRCCLCNRPRFSNSSLCKWRNLDWVGPILLGKQRTMCWALHFDLETCVQDNLCKWNPMHC